MGGQPLCSGLDPTERSVSGTEILTTQRLSTRRYKWVRWKLVAVIPADFVSVPAKVALATPKFYGGVTTRKSITSGIGLAGGDGSPFLSNSLLCAVSSDVRDGVALGTDKKRYLPSLAAVGKDEVPVFRG